MVENCDSALKFYAVKIYINRTKMDIVTIDRGIQSSINP